MIEEEAAVWKTVCCCCHCWTSAVRQPWSESAGCCDGFASVGSALLGEVEEERDVTKAVDEYLR